MTLARKALCPLLIATMPALFVGCSKPDLDADGLPSPPGPRVPERLVEGGPRPVDLLLALDDSPGMADKHVLLAEALPRLVRSLTHPPCEDASGQPLPDALQPSAPTIPCPSGSARAHEPVVDLHVGIVGSSLGGHGAPGVCESENGRGRLLAPPGLPRRFLAWDPLGAHHPPGERDAANLEAQLANLVAGVGESGCLYEAPLESIYRFLADPDPYASLSRDESGRVVKEGLDHALLEERRAFLRPDSLLVIAVVSDEDDCSIREEGFFWQVLAEAGVPGARSKCAEDFLHPCCSSCGVDPSQLPPECGPDPICEDAALPDGDPPKLRCFDQKRRYGIDFLYPTSRYVDALQSLSVPGRGGDLFSNPIFSDLDPHDDVSTIRGAGDVFFAAIVGVPWQDIARDPEDPRKGLRSAEEMRAPRPELGGAETWALVLGSPSGKAAPLDPLMRASLEPREGTHPLDARFSPTLEPGKNPINGHEWNAASAGALQLACAFSIPEERAEDCAGGACVCGDGSSPLCEAREGSGARQVRAGAEPGIRALEVARGLGDQGIAASVCGREGLGLAVDALAEKLGQRLGASCLERELSVGEDGKVACVMLEAREADGGCVCEGPGKKAVSEGSADLAAGIGLDPASAGLTCVCEIEQLGGEAAASCRHEEAASGDGFCYVDPAKGVGSEARVSMCSPDERRMFRFVGNGQPSPESQLFVRCEEGG